MEIRVIVALKVLLAHDGFKYTTDGMFYCLWYIRK